MLLNQSCDVDKGYPKLILLPVVPLATQSAQNQNLIKKNRIYANLHLPAHGDSLPESFISFLEPMVVEKSVLDSVPRIVSLGDSGRRALYIQFTRWLTRWELTEMQCPNCGLTFSPAATLPVENT